MGKTSQPLVIYLDPRILPVQKGRLAELASQGHTILPLELVPKADLILSPAAHWWTPLMWSKESYLDVAMKAARKRKKGAKGEDS